MLWSLLIGLIVGFVAKALVPGRASSSWILTSLLGIAGAMAAHFLGRGMGVYRENEPAGFLAAVLGSVLLLLLYQMFFVPKTQ